MKRIDSSTAQIDKFGPGKNGFTEGVPGVTPPTALTGGFFDAVQEELAGVIEATGVALDPNDHTQLTTAIRKSVSLQTAYDASVAAGDSPTLTLPGGNTLDFRANKTVAFEDGTVFFDQGTAPAAARMSFGSLLGFDRDDGQMSFVIGAPAAATQHGILTPLAANATAKAALVRAPGSGNQASEWMPLDSDPAWAPTVATVADISAIALDFGMWSRVGNIVTFSASGTLTASAAGTQIVWSVDMPFISAETAAVSGLINGTGGAVGISTGVLVCSGIASSTSPQRWTMNGQLILP